MTIEHRVHALADLCWRQRRREAHVEPNVEIAGYNVRRTGAGVDIGDLERGRCEELVAAVPRRGCQLVEGGQRLVDGVSPTLRIGHVTLDAVHSQRSVQRPAASIFQRIAETLARRRLAEEAVVDEDAAGREMLDDRGGAMQRVTLFVGGEENGQRTSKTARP